MEKTKKKVERPGGRNDAVRRAVAQAVIDFICEGSTRFTNQELAERAGVHRATIFRRWPDQESLMTEVFQNHIARVDVKATGNWETDLREIALVFRKFFHDPIEFAFNRVYATSNNKAFYQKLIESWINKISDIEKPILEAQRNGHINPDADVSTAVLMLIYTLTSCSLMLEEMVSDADLDKFVNQTIRGLR